MNDSMLAYVFDRGQVQARRVPLPRPGPGKALLAPLMAGICATDQELLAGYQDFSGVAGHEVVARVLKSPDDPAWEGRRVAVAINQGCGSCSWCQQGQARHCPQRKALGIHAWPGVFAMRFVAPLANLHPVPPDLPDYLAVFCEPLAAALQVAQQVHLTSQMEVAVLGDGKLGLLCALALWRLCPRLVLWGHHENKLELARAQGISTRLVGPDQTPDPGSVDLVIEATGRPQGLAQALEMVRPRGTIVAKTTSHTPTQLNLARLVVNEITLTGSRCGDLGLALAWLAGGWPPVQPLIEAVYPLAELPQALEHAGRPGALKVLISYDAEKRD